MEGSMFHVKSRDEIIHVLAQVLRNTACLIPAVSYALKRMNATDSPEDEIVLGTSVVLNICRSVVPFFASDIPCVAAVCTMAVLAYFMYLVFYLYIFFSLCFLYLCIGIYMYVCVCFHL